MSAKPDEARFTPRYPTLIAAALLCAGVVGLCLPMFQGYFLGGQWSDQTWTGIPFRQFWADEFRRTGHIPLWNPYMFGGLPFVGAMHGDIFYPVSFLRLFLRADQALDAWFFIHLVLAGLFSYAFLRTLKVSWAGALIGGLAYQLSGIVASQVSPGHDGKLAVSALLPLLLTGLVLGIRNRKPQGYALVALVVGLDILSPQVQMAQYSLILAGLFSLFLCFWDDERPAEPKQRWLALGWATLAVALGFGVSMIQILPFIKYGPYAARTAGAQGWEYATQYAMPPANIVDWFTATFTGSTIFSYYWPGGIKLHSEYIGGAVLALAAVGIAGAAARRKLSWFLGGAFLLFLLVCLGPHTPFYRLWYAVVPGVKVTRAPGMAFFIPTLIFACFAAFGVERLERGEGKKTAIGVLVAAGLLLLLGLSGGMVVLAENMAGPLSQQVDRFSNYVTLGAVLSAAAAAVAGGLALAAVKGRLKPLALALGLAAVVGADLFVNAFRYFQWSAPAPQLFASDSVTAHLRRTPAPWRALDIPAGERGSAYPTAYLMYDRIPNALGHHGNELHAYDQLLGGKNEWKNIGTTRLFDLLAVRFLVLPMNIRVPGYHSVTQAPRGPVDVAVLLEADSLPAYARVVPAAVKVPDAQIPSVLMDERWDYNRIVLLSESAQVNPPRPDTVPPPMAARASVTAWEPGAMTIRMEPVPEHDAFLVVAENWYPDWHATVDGKPVQALRGQGALITVPVPRGAREVSLRFQSAAYQRGKAITLASVGGILAWLLLPVFLRRRSG